MNAFYVIAIILFLFEVFVYVCNRRTNNRVSKSAVATVVDVNRHREHSGKHRISKFYPVLQFRAGSEEIVMEYRYGGGNTFIDYSVGDRIHIRYAPDDPTFFFMEKDLKPYLSGYIIFGFLTFLFLFFGIVCQLTK